MNKIYFCAQNSERQFFSIPKPIIRYICENPKPSPTLLYKIYFTCKFFYPKIKIIGIDLIQIRAYCRELTWPLSKVAQINEERYEHVPLPMNAIFNIDFKFCIIGGWIQFEETINRDNEVHPKFMSYFLTKLWYFEKCEFCIKDQILSSKEFKIMAETTTMIYLFDVTVFDDNGIELPCEELFKLCPFVERFTFARRQIQTGFTDRTAQALAELKRSAKLFSFYIEFVPPSFDPISFATFIKNNMIRTSKSDVTIQFNDDVTKEEELNFSEILKSFFVSKEYENIKIRISFRWE